MFDWIANIVDRGFNVIEAHRRVALRSLERAGGVVAAYIGISLVCAAGAVTALAGATVALANQIGAAGALGIMGGATIALAAGAALLLRRYLSHAKGAKTFDQLRIEVDEAHAAFRCEIAGMSADRRGESGKGSWISSLVVELTSGKRRMGVIAGVVLAGAAIIGPIRLVRLIARGVSLAGLAATIGKSFQELASFFFPVSQSFRKWQVSA